MLHSPDRTKEHDELYTRMPNHAGASMARVQSEPQQQLERILKEQMEELRTRTSRRARVRTFQLEHPLLVQYRC